MRAGVKSVRPFSPFRGAERATISRNKMATLQPFNMSFMDILSSRSSALGGGITYEMAPAMLRKRHNSQKKRHGPTELPNKDQVFSAHFD
jgi:hypothetical protein